MRTSRLPAYVVIAMLSGCKGEPPPSAPAPVPTPVPTPRTCSVVCSYAGRSWLAIAYSPSRHACYLARTFYDFEGARPAKREALASCQRSGAADCEVVVWGDGGVAAVAANGPVYGWGWAEQSSAVAETRAVELCQSRMP